MRLAGWRTTGEVPRAHSVVIIAAPHTSNWDFIYLVAAAYCFRIRINWLGKNSLFFPVFGAFMRFMGGIPVDRSQANNMVTDLATRIRESDGINLVVPPSGTRARTEYWKSGFYRIAEAADIPMICSYLDYAKKEAGLGPTFKPSNLGEDMDRIRAFYEPIAAKFPENKSRIRLREEDSLQ